MKPKTMILMGVAVVCGLGASYMTSRLLADRDNTPEEKAPPPPEVKVKILVAKTNLDHGSALKNPDEMFKIKEFRQDDAPKDGIADTKALKGKYLKRPLRKDDHVTPEDLMDEKTSLLANLPDGYRGIGVPVTNDTSGGGFATLPGNKVDILLTIKKGSDKDSMSRYLLADVLMLAVDQTTQRDTECKAMPGGIVTLALNQIDVMKVDLAKKYGPLTLLVRKFGDTTPPPDQEWITGEDIMKGSVKDSKKELNKPAPKNLGTPNGDDPIVLVPQLKKQPDDKKEVVQDVRPDVKPEVKKEVVVEPPQPKRYFRTVTIRQGDKVTRQVFEVDVNGDPIQDDVTGEQYPEPPAVDQAPHQRAPQAQDHKGARKGK